MSDSLTNLDEMGAIDYVVVEFPRRKVTGELIPELLRMVDSGQIHILDVVIVLTADDGSYETLIPDDLDPAEVGDIGALAGASSGLLGEEDVAQIAGIMEPNAGSLAMVYENLWSLPFASAARRSGGQVISLGHIPTQAVMAALDELEA